MNTTLRIELPAEQLPAAESRALNLLCGALPVVAPVVQYVMFQYWHLPGVTPSRLLVLLGGQYMAGMLLGALVAHNARSPRLRSAAHWYTRSAIWIPVTLCTLVYVFSPLSF